MTEHSWVHVNCCRVKKVCVQVFGADETTKSNAGILGQVAGCDWDGKAHWQNPTNASQPPIVSIDQVVSPHCQLGARGTRSRPTKGNEIGGKKTRGCQTRKGGGVRTSVYALCAHVSGTLLGNSSNSREERLWPYSPDAVCR